MPSSIARSLLSGAATPARRVLSVLHSGGKAGSHSMFASKHVTSALPRDSKNSAVALVATAGLPQIHSTTALTSVSASGEAVSIQSRTLNPHATAWSGQDENPVPHPLPRRFEHR